MERDDGNLFVLEATMISLILLGAAYAVQGLQDSSQPQARPRAELSRLVDDALSVLAGLDTGNGTLLDLYLAEAIHCATDPSPSADDCDGARSRNLSMKLDSYLPLGGGYAVGLGNGGAVREIYRSPMPQGEGVSSSQTFAPNWSLAFAYTEMSCYDAGTDVNATLLPIARGAKAWSQKANVSVTGVAAEVEAVRAHDPLAWNVTLSSATRPASGTVTANFTGNFSFNGSTTYASCAHGGATAALRTALAQIPFTASAPSVPITSSVTFSADLGPLATLVPDAVVSAANVTLVEPIPARLGSADSWVVAARVPLAGGTVRTGTWTPAETSLYGAHPALLRVGLDLGGVPIELRKAIVVRVALPTGEVPIDPPYRATLQAWLADWG